MEGYAGGPRGRRIFWMLLCCCCMWMTGDAGSHEKYRYLSYHEINGHMIGLSRKYSDILRVYSAHREFNLPTAGMCRDAYQKQTVPCTVLVADLGVRPIESTRPQVLIIGSIHGDERLGAQVAFHLIKMLVLTFKTDPWVQRLMKTRRIVIVPMPNPYGFDRAMRFEEVEGELVDPNLDFPIDQSDSSNCMKSITARVINELFQRNLFRLALVFHAKKSPLIGYSWGGENRCLKAELNVTEPNPENLSSDCIASRPTPDEAVMQQIGQHMSTFAGELEGQFYKVGSLNDPEIDSTFPTTMVDWAYGASFTENVTQCTPSTYGGYAPERTRYNDATNRCITFVVETSRDSSPTEKELGEPRGLYARRQDHGNGHIPRNLRLSLLAIDVAAPYVFFLSSPGAKVDLMRGGILRMKWSIGGAFTVLETYLEVEIVRTKETFTTEKQSGGSMWAQNHGIEGHEKRSEIQGKFTLFSRGYSVKWAYSEAIRLLSYVPAEVQKLGSDLNIRAIAKVDHSWSEVNETRILQADGNETITKEYHSESHIARSRGDTEWRKASGDFEVLGGDYIYSDVITMRLPPKTLRNSFYGYVIEMILWALVLFIAPPIIIAIFWRKMPNNHYVHRNLRKAMRAFSQKDIVEEVARLREQRKGPKPRSFPIP